MQLGVQACAQQFARGEVVPLAQGAADIERLIAIAAPGRRTDPGLRARFRDLTDMRPDLEVLPTRDGRSAPR